MQLRKEELLMVVGGGISGSLINALARGLESILDVGRSLGSALRRIISRRTCKI